MPNPGKPLYDPSVHVSFHCRIHLTLHFGVTSRNNLDVGLLSRYERSTEIEFRDASEIVNRHVAAWYEWVPVLCQLVKKPIGFFRVLDSGCRRQTPASLHVWDVSACSLAVAQLRYG